MNELSLSWMINAQALSGGQSAFSYEATAGERVDLATYIGVSEVQALSVNVRIKPLAGGRYKVQGHYKAIIVQLSVISLNPVVTHIEEPLLADYCPAETSGEQEGIVAGFATEGPEPLVNGAIPIGALVSELLAVAVDPYPRNEGETFDWAGDASQKQQGPFAGLLNFKGVPKGDKV